MIQIERREMYKHLKQADFYGKPFKTVNIEVDGRVRAFDLSKKYGDGTLCFNVRNSARKRLVNAHKKPRIACFWINPDGTLRKADPKKEKLYRGETMAILDRWEKYAKIFADHIKKEVVA